MTIAMLKDHFIKYFGSFEGDDLKVYFSPGRVNLIGEHIDFSGGKVLPCAIDMGTYAVIRKRIDTKVQMISLNFEQDGMKSFDIAEPIVWQAEMDWANYPMGVFRTLQDDGAKYSTGYDILFWGDLPNGAGLSSSASIEVLMAVMLNEEQGLGYSRERIAVLCQKSENTFNHVNCGIMDQFIVAVGSEEHAILLNCDTLDYEHIPADFGAYRIVIMNTNKKRGLVDSAYNNRRSDCERALAVLQNAASPEEIPALCSLTPKAFLSRAEVLSEVEYKRAAHAVTENYRTLKSKEALQDHDLIAFGEWMYRSHDSLKSYYEVSCKELDVVVEFCRSQPFLLGARMTGAGFGGCAIALVHERYTADFEKALKVYYHEQTGLDADVYIAKVSAGARRLS